MKRTAILLLLAGLANPALAVSNPGEMLPDPAAEQRAEALGAQLRCMVCQNESIEDSDADLARDLRHIIRTRITEGDSDKQVIDWLVARYGNFVRLRPPVDATTLLLWGSPLLALLAGLAAVLLGRRRRAAAAAPLSTAEQAEISRLLQS